MTKKNVGTTLPQHLHDGAAALIAEKDAQLAARITREHRGEMDDSDILDRLLAVMQWYNDLPQSITMWIPAPDLYDTAIEAVHCGLGRSGEIAFYLERIEWPAVVRRCGRVDVPMVRATFFAKEVE